MSNSFEMPPHAALLTEQAVVQAEKFQGSNLAAYDIRLFSGQGETPPRESAVTDLVRPLVGTGRVTLQTVLDGMYQTKSGELVNWADMGGGRGLAMRQLGSMGLGARVHMTNVDLFDFGLKDLNASRLALLEDMSPGVTQPEYEPILVMDNMETVKLPEAPDIITSLETMQYLNNPLAALANWYNQLAHNGLMIVFSEGEWTEAIRYRKGERDYERRETPFKHLFEDMSQAGIAYAATKYSDRRSGVRLDVDPNDIRVLAVQKKPGTAFEVTAPVVGVQANQYDYKFVYYGAQEGGSGRAIEVVNTDARAA